MTQNSNRPDTDIESMALPPELADVERALAGLTPVSTKLDADTVLCEAAVSSYPAPQAKRRIWMHGAVAGLPLGIALGAAAAAILMGIFMKQDLVGPGDPPAGSPDADNKIAEGELPLEDPSDNLNTPIVDERENDAQLADATPTDPDQSLSPQAVVPENFPASASRLSIIAGLFGIGKNIREPEPVRPVLDPEDLDGYLAEMQILAERMESAANRMGSGTRIYHSSPSYEYRPAADGTRLRPFDAASLLENEYFYENPFDRNPAAPPEDIPDSDSSDDVLPPSFGSLDSDVSRTL
jgi:hypothetical protein